MAHTPPGGHHAVVVLGLVLGLAASAWVGLAAHDHVLAANLPDPWLTAGLGLGVLVVGWVMANTAPRFAAALAGAAAPGAAYAAIMLAGDGEGRLAYGWTAVPVALVLVAAGSGLRAAHRRPRSWSSSRATAPKVPRLRTR